LEDPPRFTITEWPKQGPSNVIGDYPTLEEARAAMPDPAYRVIPPRPLDVNMRRATQQQQELAEAAALAAQSATDDDEPPDF
jgi:hypothetical protein